VIGDFHEPYGAVLVGGIWYAIQSTAFLRAVTIAASIAEQLFFRQSIRKGGGRGGQAARYDHDPPGDQWDSKSGKRRLLLARHEESPKCRGLRFSACPEKPAGARPTRAAWGLMILATLRSVSHAAYRRSPLAIGRNTAPDVTGLITLSNLYLFGLTYSH
jgi:hypothetical protein